MTNEELVAAWVKQVNRLISLGFNREIGKSEGTYRRLLPLFTHQPEAYKGRFEIPLLVDPRISLKKQHKLAGISSTIHEEKIVDTIKIPDVPYAIWTHDANRYRQFSVKDAIGKFQADEMSCPQMEVTALYIQYPEFFKDHGVDATGSLYGADGVPCINTFFGKPEMSHGSLDHPDSRWGPLSRGRKIQFAANISGH